MNEFSTEFNGTVAVWIEMGEHATADAIASLNDMYGDPGAAQLACRGQSSHAAADDNYRQV